MPAEVEATLEVEAPPLASSAAGCADQEVNEGSGDEWDLTDPGHVQGYLMENFDERDLLSQHIDPENKKRLISFICDKLLAKQRAQRGPVADKLSFAAIFRNDLGDALDSKHSRRKWLWMWWQRRELERAPKRKP